MPGPTRWIVILIPSSRMIRFLVSNPAPPAPGELPRLRTVRGEAISQLQRGFLTEEQIDSSRTIMGLDTQFIEDGTYFVVEARDEIAGCGGWSRRATLYGSDHSAGRRAHLLDPAVDAARVRAMYTAPAFARRGVG